MPGENLSDSIFDKVIKDFEGLKTENENLVKEIKVLSKENNELEDKKKKLVEENKRLLKVLVKSN